MIIAWEQNLSEPKLETEVSNLRSLSTGSFLQQGAPDSCSKALAGDPQCCRGSCRLSGLGIHQPCSLESHEHKEPRGTASGIRWLVQRWGEIAGFLFGGESASNPGVPDAVGAWVWSVLPAEPLHCSQMLSFLLPQELRVWVWNLQTDPSQGTCGWGTLLPSSHSPGPGCVWWAFRNSFLFQSLC